MAFGSFTAKVRLRDATYEMDGLTYFVAEWLDWGEVPYVEPNECCCREDHDQENCTEERCCGLMCRDCVESWSIDHEVQLPSLI